MHLPSPTDENCGTSLTPSSGPVVLLSNPLVCDLTSWDHVVPQLNAREFRALRYDNPDNGGSDVLKDLSSDVWKPR